MAEKDSIKELKSWVLGLGYPLENVVDEALGSLKPIDGAEINKVRDYSFQVLDDEANVESIRSIDFLLSVSYPYKNIPHRDWHQSPSERLKLVFLIDAKYSNDEFWGFTPRHSGPNKMKDSLPCLVPMYTYKDFGRDLKAFDKKLLEARTLPEFLSRTSNGRKLKQKEDHGPVSIASNQKQLFECFVDVVGHEHKRLGEVAFEGSVDYWRESQFYIPIITTNSKLFLLRSMITTQEIESAEKEQDLGKYVDSLILDFPDLADAHTSLKALTSNVNNKRSKGNLVWFPNMISSFPVLIVHTPQLADTVSRIIEGFESLLPKSEA